MGGGLVAGLGMMVGRERKGGKGEVDDCIIGKMYRNRDGDGRYVGVCGVWLCAATSHLRSEMK